MILLQIVMVSPGTHLEKNHESHCRANEFQFKKLQVLNWKCLGLYVTRQLVWRQTQKLCIKQVTEIKIMLYSVYRLKVQQKTKRKCVVLKTTARTATEITWTGYSTNYNILRWNDQSLHPMGRIAMNHFAPDFYASGRQDTEVTKSLE